jgi:hypothetical protein
MRFLECRFIRATQRNQRSNQLQSEKVVSSQIALTPVSTARTVAAVLAAFILPGLGHLVLGKWARAILLGLTIAALFMLGFWMEGHLFWPERNEWLTWFFSFLDMGMGLPYFACLVADKGFAVTPEQAAKITFEYGNTFLCVAGALNMLSALDAYDIAIGRKP